MIIVKVILPLPIRKYFKYYVPNNMLIPIIGSRVVVPFRSKELIGIVLSIDTLIQTNSVCLKFITSIIDHKSIYNDILLDLLVWLSNYYYVPIGSIFFSILPKFLRTNCDIPKRYAYKWTVTNKGLQIDLYKYIKTKKQLYVLLFLQKNSIFDYELKKLDISKSILNRLTHQKLCTREVLSKEYVNIKYIFSRKKNFFLNKNLICVIEDILNKKSFLSYVLTETSIYTKVKFYLGIIEKILKKGSQILILVPYIHYIHRIQSILNTYFHVSIEVIHSKLNNARYLEQWLNIKHGEKNIIIGTYTSIFFPFLKLGLIIIFEEHSRQYDCLSQFRYNARDIGILLAFKVKIPIILDSDTPSLRTIQNILLKKYHCISIKKTSVLTRIQHTIIDLKNERLQVGLSVSLINEIHLYIVQKKCILLIFNKFNFTFLGLMCSNCGWVAKCNSCQDYYEVNKYYHILSCKYCLIKIKKPLYCGNCGVYSLIIFDFSITRIKNKLKHIFPNVPMIFLLKKKNMHDKKIDMNFFKSYFSKAYIIITTDKIVQNYLFPHVHLIGLIDIDIAFLEYNFRSIEHFSQFYIGLNKLIKNKITLIKIFIQTSFPYNTDLLELCNNGYFSLAKKILKHRKRFLLPPWSYQIIVYAKSASAENTCNFLYLLYAILNKKSKKDNISIWLSGPHPCFLLRYNIDIFYQLLIQCSSRVYLNQLLKKSIRIMDNFPISKKVKWFLEINCH